LPDERFGEIVCAAIVLHKDKVRSVTSLPSVRDRGVECDLARKKFQIFSAKSQLTRYKNPRRIFILPSLPQNSSGKVLKYKVKEICLEIMKQNKSLHMRSKL